MPMSVGRFNAQLRRQGQDMGWAKASKCPCLDADSGAARRGCPVCRGLGVFWSAPVASHAGLSGMKVQREWQSFGEYQSGDVVVSVPSNTPLYTCGENDRVTFTQSSRSFDIVLTRGDVGEIIRSRVLAFDRCFRLLPDGSATVECALPIQAADGTIAFADGAVQPDPGQQYTVMGRCVPEYFLFKDLAQDRAHYGGLPLPRKLALRLFDLFGR